MQSKHGATFLIQLACGIAGLALSALNGHVHADPVDHQINHVTGGPGALASTLSGPTVASVVLSPSSLEGGCGETSTATVTLSAAAPTGGQPVVLASSISALAAVLPSITVPAGQSGATFTIWTNPKYRRYSGLAFSPVISASANGGTQSATLSISAGNKPADIQNDTADRHGDVCGGSFPATFGERGILYACFAGPTPGTAGHCTFKQECLASGCEPQPANGFLFSDVCGTGAPYPISENPPQVVGASASTGTVDSYFQAPAGGVTTTIHDSAYCVTVPFNVTIPQGKTSANFSISNTDTSVGRFVGLGVDVDGAQEGVSFYTILPSGTCKPGTCASLGYNCDIQQDGCCGYIDCGSCAAPDTCGGGGQFGICGCTPNDECQLQGYTCGAVSDGCGGSLNCGTCPGGQYCSLFYHHCESCPSSCALLGFNCGSTTDPCTGKTLNCGNCGNGTGPCIDNVCCIPQDACANNGYDCGSASDGCGNTLNCGSCGAGQTCVNHVCMDSVCGGSGTCTPVTCSYLGMDCGATADGCGGTLNCGACSSGASCVGNVCETCNPYTCYTLGFSCGSAPDGCGGTLNCGRCKKGKSCVNNVCR
jgi:hypothetical protein